MIQYPPKIAPNPHQLTKMGTENPGCYSGGYLFKNLDKYLASQATIYLTLCTQMGSNNHQQGVCHAVTLPFTLKKYLKKAKEELRKLKYFTMQKI
jgi:hypothetical protein